MNESHVDRLEGAFRFKRFTIRQTRCPMKVGTDGVLLGAWVEVRPSDRRILDIGTGTGLIAVMLAQRSPEALITGVDIDDVTEARENGDASPWGDRLRFEQTPIQDFLPAERYDLIVSNPPFYVDSLTCPDRGRTTARHAVHLSYGELIDAVVRLLAPGGRFGVVLPTSEAERFRRQAAARLGLLRLTQVRTTPRRPVKRVLMEFSPIPSPGAATISAAVTTPGPVPNSAAIPVPASAPGSVPDSAVPASAPAPVSVSVAIPAMHPSISFAAASVPPATAAVTVSNPGPQIDELIIGTGQHETYTPEYRALTGDFYLKF